MPDTQPQQLDIQQGALLPTPAEKPIQADTGYTATPDGLTTTGYTTQPAITPESRSTVIAFPSGHNVAFPASMSMDAVRDAAKNVWEQLKTETGALSQGLGGPATLSEAAQAAKNTPTGVMHPWESLKAAVSGVVGSANNAALMDKAQAAWQAGDKATAIRHGVAALIPFVGQNIDTAGNEAVSGDYAESIGHTLSAILPFLLSGTEPAAVAPEAAPEVPKQIVGTAEGAQQDTALFAKAKAELGADASISDVAKRAQDMKVGTPLPKAVPVPEVERPDVPTFFSKAEQVIRDKVPNNASGDQISALLKNAGVKADEMKWAGLDEFLKDKPSVSKADLQQFIHENQIQLKDVDLGAKQNFNTEPNAEETGRAGEPIVDVIDRDSGLVRFTGTPDAAKDFISETIGQKTTKYDKWTLPGEKENYQEKLLTLPNKITAERLSAIDAYNSAEKERSSYLSAGKPVPEDVQNRWANAQKVMSEQAPGPNPNYVGPHWGEEPNVVAHVRFDDRPAVDGKKTLFMEEAQSDWHSAGRHEGYQGNPKEIDAADTALRQAKDAKTALVQSVVDRVNAEQVAGGYMTPAELDEYNRLVNESRDFQNYGANAKEEYDAQSVRQRRIAELEKKAEFNKNGLIKMANADNLPWAASKAMTPEEQAKYATLNSEVNKASETKRNLTQGAVPDAPFKQSWHELVMKRMLRESAEKGYDQLAWTTGDQQADLYDLSKHIGRIEYDPEQNQLRAYDPQGKKVIEENVDPTVKELAPYIGQDHAENLVGQIEDYSPPSQPDPDWFYESASEGYDVDEREVPDENQEFATVPEREEHDDYVRTLAKKYGLDPQRTVWNDLTPKLTPRELAKGKHLREAARDAEEEQESQRGTITQYFVTTPRGDEHGPFDSEREAREDMGARIDNDVEYEMQNYEPEQADLPEITNLNEHKGGEFHHLLYDTMIPSFLKKYAKKWGAEVGTTEIKGMGVPETEYVGPEFSAEELRAKLNHEGEYRNDPAMGYSETQRLKEVIHEMTRGRGMPLKDAMLALDAANKPAVHDLAEVLGGKFNRTPANQKVHSIDITPDMRKSVMKVGQPIAKAEQPSWQDTAMSMLGNQAA